MTGIRGVDPCRSGEIRLFCVKINERFALSYFVTRIVAVNLPWKIKQDVFFASSAPADRLFILSFL